jgi:bifunctional DNA-binding transcriptional regulator/antitoxin component of YhaV-PrlF toxin-antitoxin module
LNNETKLYKGWQTVVPLEIRKKLNVDSKDVLEWNITPNGKAIVTFKKKKTIHDIVGIAHSEKKTNAVKLKKRAQLGEDKI